MIPTGRGAAMQRFLAAMQDKQVGEEEKPEEPPTGRGRMLVETLVEGMTDVEIARPSGRGRVLPSQSLVELGRPGAGQESIERRPEPTQPTSQEPARAVGRGRSALLAAFLSQQKSQDSVPGKLPLSSSAHSPSPPVQSPPRFTTKLPSPPAMLPLAVEKMRSSQHSGAPPEVSSIGEPVVQRGRQGRSDEVVCNYIDLDKQRGKGVFEYSAEFNPSEDNVSMKARMINQHLERLGGVKSFNGVKLFLSIELDKITKLRCQHPASEMPVEMTLICKGAAMERDVADIYNMLFRRIMVNLGLKNMGRKFFDPSGAVNIPQHRLEVWPGYITSVQLYEGGVKLCCDASHRVMRTESVLEIMMNLARTSPQRYQEETMKTLLGAVVLTRYNSRVYRVDDVSWNQSPQSTFTDSNNTEISFLSYYKTNYNIDIKDMRQPLLISKVERKKNAGQKVQDEVRLICLVPELCYITGLSDAMRADFRVMKELSQKLQLTPVQRYEGLCKFLQNIGENKPSQELLMKWGLRVASRPIQLTARVVPSETILYGENGVNLPPGSSSWVVNNSLLVSKQIQNWAILHVGQDFRVAQNFENEMRKVCSQMGMKIYQGKLVKVSDNQNSHFLDALRSTIVPNLQLIVIFFPSLRSDRYAAVKKVCCIEKPISSQVIQSRTLSRPEKARSIIKKIAMQINCKLGGALWGLKIPFEKLMVCGMDVYHGANHKESSVMGFVATSDPQQTTWFSRVGFGVNNQEIADNLRLCTANALKKYREVSGFYPERIIMFRDGVGDGQLRVTREFEIPQILLGFKCINEAYKPKLTVVICQKRILARLISVQGSESNRRFQNPSPGTVMDNTITRYDYFDFFLVSQSSNRGTVSPTHYIVVYDDSQIQPDHIQRMTYKMTHLYYNWTGTISTPAPVLYAHRLAQLVGQHLHKNPSAELSDRLYFL